MDFSVIIPAHNEERCIEKTLVSVPKKVEIIVVCNACTDSTEKIAKKYAKVISIPEPNVSIARNEGVKNCKGDIVIFLDADTSVLSKNFFDEIEKTLKKSVVGTCKALPDTKTIKARIAMKIKNAFLWTGWSSGIIFCKRETFEKMKGFSEVVFLEDMMFSECLNKEGRIAIIDHPVIVSSRKYLKNGVIKQILRNVRVVLGYKIFHESPVKLREIYAGLPAGRQG